MMQVIKYKWLGFLPQLVVKDDNELKAMELLNKKFNLIIGKKFCSGFFRAGRHFPCKNQRETEDRLCNECKLEDDYFFCMRCDGSECINPKKRDECKASNYYIYLAAFGSLLKVGISYEFRIMERLVEQGADFGAKVARVQDGKLVRAIEQKIRREMKIADRITGEQKHAMLFGNPNTAVSSIFRAISLLKNNGFSEHLIGPEIYDLRGYYYLKNVLSYPQELQVDDGTTIDGRIVAAKGNILVVQQENKFFSINAHSLIGRKLESIN